MSGLILGGLAATGVLTWLGVAWVRGYAIKEGIVDVPGARSSHRVPTPRGGGLAIVVVALGGIGLATLGGVVPSRLGIALVGGGTLVAGIGWLDDRRTVAPRIRLAVHTVAAAWAIGWLGGFPTVRLGDTDIWLGPPGTVLGIVAIVWAINLYNFMDGVDGLAAVEAISVGGIAGLLLVLQGQPMLAVPSLMVASAAAGFLPWNWEPAKIFMGDAGSGTLGYVFAVLALGTEVAGALPVTAWGLLLGVFIADASLTLLWRIWRRERWYAPHRSHAYQRILRSGMRHRTVTTAVLAINVVLGVLAYTGVRRPVLLPWMVLVGLVFLLATYIAAARLRPKAE